MEGAGGVVEDGLRSVIIRTPDQRVKDMEVTCQPKWTVANLKHHLSLLYPGNPTEDKQRLILAGKLLQDKTQLEELFKTYEYRPIIHFVCTQTLPEPVSEVESTATTAARSTRSSVSSPANPPGDQNPAPARPTLHIPGGNPRWSAHMSQLHMWHQQLEENQAAFYHQHHLTQALLRRAAEQAQERATPAPPPRQQQEPQQPVQPPQPAQPPQDPEEQHDLLDVFYIIIRALFLLAMAWNYASPAKFCFMGVLLFYLYLYQSGYIEMPAIFPRTRNEPAEEGEEAREISRLSILKNALLSFFTSLMPSNENVN